MSPSSETQTSANPVAIGADQVQPLTAACLGPTGEQEQDHEHETPAPQPAPEPVLDPAASSALPAIIPIDQPPPAPAAATRPESDAIQMSSALGAVEGLSDDEGMEFLACETVIDTGWRGVMDVGLAFACIRDKRLYRVEFDTFEAYCQSKWQYGRRYVNRVIAGAELFRDLGTNSSQKPERETQLRPLIGLPLAQAQQAWEHAVKNAGGRKITARLVKNAVKETQQGATATPVAQAPRVNKAEQRRLIDNSVGQLLALISQKVSYDLLTEKVELLHSYIQPLFAKKSGR